MSDEVESTIKMMENYHKKGGDYIIPAEVANDIKNLIIELEKEKNNIFDTGIKECLRIRDMKDKEIERLNNIIFNQNKRNSHQRIANDNLQNKNKELNNIINELEKKIISICETCYEDRETARIEKWIKDLKG